MAALRQITGVRSIIQKMTAAKTKTGGDVARGLKKGGLFLQGKSEDIVPVQLGNLKNSSFCRNVGGSGVKTDITVGYTADYAAIVHEDLEKTHGKDFNVKHAVEIRAASEAPRGTAKARRGTAKGGMFNRGEDQQAKFLEAPAREFRKEILKRVYEEAKF